MPKIVVALVSLLLGAFLGGEYLTWETKEDVAGMVEEIARERMEGCLKAHIDGYYIKCDHIEPDIEILRHAAQILRK